MPTAIERAAVVDLFCGVGGLTHGFVLEGFAVLAGVDVDPSCQFAYERNNQARFINGRIEELSSDEIAKLYPKDAIKILVGCAPCQPFSQYKKKKGSRDEKWRLLGSFADLIEQIEPDIVSMENVPELVKFDGGRVYKQFADRLSKRLSVTMHNVFCPNYGVPQNRTRLVVFGSKYGPIAMAPHIHAPDSYKTVRRAIGHLPKIGAGEADVVDRLHWAAGLSVLNLKRIRQSRPGGTWRDWDADLVAECHKRATGQSYDSVYGRMQWDRPAPTITTECNGYGNGRFGHPEQDRAISMREAALLQTFPYSYEFLDPNRKWHLETLARLIGNAVPVELGRAIARSIGIHLGGMNV